MCEERAIYLGLVGAGALPVAGWLVRGGAAGAGVTLSLISIGLGFRAWPRACVGVATCSRAPRCAGKSRYGGAVTM